MVFKISYRMKMLTQKYRFKSRKTVFKREILLCEPELPWSREDVSSSFSFSLQIEQKINLVLKPILSSLQTIFNMKSRQAEFNDEVVLLESSQITNYIKYSMMRRKTVNSNVSGSNNDTIDTSVKQQFSPNSRSVNRYRWASLTRSQIAIILNEYCDQQEKRKEWKPISTFWRACKFRFRIEIIYYETL